MCSDRLSLRACTCVLYLCTRVSQEYVDDVIKNNELRRSSATIPRTRFPLSFFNKNLFIFNIKYNDLILYLYCALLM